MAGKRLLRNRACGAVGAGKGGFGTAACQTGVLPAPQGCASAVAISCCLMGVICGEKTEFQHLSSAPLSSSAAAAAGFYRPDLHSWSSMPRASPHMESCPVPLGGGYNPLKSLPLKWGCSSRL